MAKKAFVVTGLGYGDEGKGTTTHWLSSRYKAHTVIRTGGPQALHRVVYENGKEHAFSQFGSGTFRGAATHLSKHMVIDPHAILKEGEVLAYERGIRGVFEWLTIHEDALVITPFQAIACRLRELMRGENRHGSVGIGVGETVLDAEVPGDGAIRAKDLDKPYLREKLQAIQRRKLAEFEELADRASLIPADMRERVRSEIAELTDPDTVQWAVERFTELAKRVRIVDTDYVARQILGPEGTVIFEGSQGVLLDRWHGFHPYTTKVRTVPEIALSLLDECGYDGEVKSFGVLRAYHTRHGAGPFVSESPALTKKLPDLMNKTHPWQGDFRIGHFDAVAARYAIEASGKESIDGLIVTCLDRIWPLGRWQVCNTYGTPREVRDAESFFRLDAGSISGITAAYGNGGGAEQLERQERLGQLLGWCFPEFAVFGISPWDAKENFIDLCASVLEENLGVPIVAVSIGATEEEKIEIKNGQ